MLDRNSETRIKASDILTDKWFIISTKQLESKSINSISKISDIKSLNKSLLDSEPEKKPVRSSKFKIDRNTKKNYKATNVLLNVSFFHILTMITMHLILTFISGASFIKSKNLIFLNFLFNI
jgi:hypothetical protein